MSVNLAELAFEDDLDIGMDPETYVDQANPAPPYGGNYAFQVKKYSNRTVSKDDKTIKLVDGKYPIITLEMVTIVEGLDKERQFGLFQDIGTAPRKFGERIGTTPLGDLTRAYDQTRVWQGTKAGLETLQEFLDTNGIFRAQLNWAANDFEWAKAEIAKLGLEGSSFAERNDDENKKVNEIYNKAKLKGMSKFPKHANGRPNHVWQGPSGNLIEARPELTRFYPSNETVKLGSFYKG